MRVVVLVITSKIITMFVIFVGEGGELWEKVGASLWEYFYSYAKVIDHVTKLP
jgi:hypothetical protein